MTVKRKTQNKPYAAYIRVSRVGDREERLRSPEYQRQAIERFAQAEKLEIEWFKPELDVSGSKAKRPILDEILARIRSGELGGIVVAKLDRLSRLRPKERVLLFEEIEDAGAVILSASEQLDPSTPEGRFARDVFLGVARMQWEKYRDGWETAKEHAISKGVPISPRPAVGYRRVQTEEGMKLVPDENAPFVRRVFQLRAEGEGPSALGDFLSENGVKTSMGSQTWSKQAIYNLIKNRVYLGEISFGQDKRYVNANAHEPIIDLPTWMAAQNPDGKISRLRSEDSSWLLTGIARCGNCRYALQGTTTSRGKRIYRCTARHAGGRCPQPVRVQADQLEAIADDFFRGVTFREEVTLINESENKSEIQKLEDHLARAERRLDQALQPEVGEAAGDRWAVMISERRKDVEDAATTLGKAQLGSQTTTEVPLESVYDECSTAEKRSYLAQKISPIAVYKNEIIFWPEIPDDLPKRGFKTAPTLRAFGDAPQGAVATTVRNYRSEDRTS